MRRTAGERAHVLAAARSPILGLETLVTTVAVLAVAGCGAGSAGSAGSVAEDGRSSEPGLAPAAGQSGAPSPGQLPSAGGPAPSRTSAGTSPGSAGQPTPTGARPAGTGTRGPTRFPSPAAMAPPAATAASVVGCQALTGGGWQATFTVTLTGGTDWAVVPQHGPANRTGADQWTVVIRQGTSSGATIALTRIEVGGGTPYRTATVTLGPGVATAATCPS